MTQAVALAQQASTGVSQGFKNRIINGAMVIDQRNAGASVTPTASTYLVDRFQTVFGGSTPSKLSFQQTTTAPTSFSNSLKITSTSAYSLASGDFFQLEQSIEGYNTSDLGYGSANAKTVTLSFWVQSSLTGTFGMFLANGANTRLYPATYTVNSANTWEQKTITLNGDTSGTWNTTNTTGLRVVWTLGYGSNYTSGTAGAWATANGSNFIPSGCTSLVGTSGATFYITGVQLEVGSTATSFDYLDYGRSLIQCQRYFWRMNGRSSGGNATFAAGQVYNSTDVRAVLTNPVPMRADTSITFTGTNFAYSNAGSVKTLGTPLAADQTTQTALLYSGAGTTSATQGQAAFWVITNTDSFISVSAEL